MGTKYHLAVDGDGTPVACAVTAVNRRAKGTPDWSAPLWVDRLRSLI